MCVVGDCLQDFSFSIARFAVSASAFTSFDRRVCPRAFPIVLGAHHRRGDDVSVCSLVVLPSQLEAHNRQDRCVVRNVLAGCPGKSKQEALPGFVVHKRVPWFEGQSNAGRSVVSSPMEEMVSSAFSLDFFVWRQRCNLRFRA